MSFGGVAGRSGVRCWLLLRLPAAPLARLAALALAGALTSHAAVAQAQPGAQPLQQLPSAVEAALARARVPREAVTLLVADAEGAQAPRLAWRAQAPVNPASIMKLVTTFAALDVLGPAYTWTTPVYVDGPIANGVLSGNLYIKGTGDPKLVIERLWLLLRRVQGLGIHTITGDIVLDRSAFEAVEADPNAFDGEGLRPYNAAPDALLVNYKSVLMTFVPNRGTQTAQVNFEPSLTGVQMQTSVPLSAGDCGDWRAALAADYADPARIRFAGSYPASCGEKVWAVAYVDPRSYAARAVGGLWGDMGSQLKGAVRDGRVPAGLKPVFEVSSPPLAEVIRDINKYSNNVMAQQVFLTLGLQQKGRGTLEAARTTIRQWWNERIGSGGSPPTGRPEAANAPLGGSDAHAAASVGAPIQQPVFDNGSGLSRSERITAAELARMLQVAWRSPAMSELMSSLPASGVDGTLRKRALRGGGAAHLKTGTLRDAAGVAGYVDGASGKRWIVVAIANHANAAAARPAFDALVDWAAQD